MKKTIFILLCLVSIQSISQESFLKARKYSFYVDTLRIKTPLYSTNTADSVLVLGADSIVRKMAISDVAGGGAVFETLSDGPGSFSGQSGKSVRVNVGETALEYFTAPGSIPGAYLITHTSGTTWTTPADITTSTRFKITMVGAGGGGGGSNTTNGKASGGGAGGALVVYVTGLSPSTGYTMAIGAAGAGGVNTGGTGGTGGNTTLTIGATTYTASGGTGGNSSTTPGAGGTGTNGDINITGQAGGKSAGGASASVPGTSGGSPGFGLGVGGAAQGSTGQGIAGTGYGAGGGGGVSTTSTGGDGTQGIIIIEYVN